MNNAFTNPYLRLSQSKRDHLKVFEQEDTIPKDESGMLRLDQSMLRPLERVLPQPPWLIQLSLPCHKTHNDLVLPPD